MYAHTVTLRKRCFTRVFFAVVWVLLIFYILVEDKPPTNEELSIRLFNAGTEKKK